MKTINELEVNDKSVIVRVDYNVPIKDGKILDNSKIVASVKTINYLLDRNAKVILLSHLGRVKEESDKAKNSLKIVANELANVIGKKVKFISACYGKKVKELVDNTPNGEIILLENTRWMDYPEKLESGNNATLAEYWASLGHVYINDAFGSSHRAHASTAGICKYLPSGIGFLVIEELKELDILLHNPPHPFTVIMGGAKVDDKITLIKSLLTKCDYLLVGGGIANAFLKAEGKDVGNSLVPTDENIYKELKNLLDTYKEKIILPVDFVKDGDIIYDVGEETIKLFTPYIAKSKLIFVNGTLGKYEEELYSKGTQKLFKILAEGEKTVIIGGGDTASAVRKFGYENSYKHISTGGGATLEYIANESLEALKWME